MTIRDVESVDGVKVVKSRYVKLLLNSTSARAAKASAERSQRAPQPRHDRQK